MRGLASCYNEHAIRVSDSYCSRPSTQSYLCPKLNHSTRYSVSCIYRVKSETHERQYLITLTWSKKFLGQGFTINVTATSPEFGSDSDDSLQLRKVRGNETFDSEDDYEVQVIWDLSAAKFDEFGLEPVRGFYVAVLVESELCLRLGDEEIPLDEWELDGVGRFWMVSRKEMFFGYNSAYEYATKVRFSEAGREHEIAIKCGGVAAAEGEGAKKADVVSVCMDEKRLFEVKRLSWNFRGNQTLFVDGLVVDMMWDLHDWLFGKEGCAVFLFRTRTGFDSRLWLEDKNLKHRRWHKVDDDINDFSFMICSCKNVPH